MVAAAAASASQRIPVIAAAGAAPSRVLFDSKNLVIPIFGMKGTTYIFLPFLSQGFFLFI